jgi:predicted TIM-barrel fold metal-dependent hydrolase
MWNPKTELEHLMSLNLTDDEYEMILQNNAKRILKLQ